MAIIRPVNCFVSLLISSLILSLVSCQFLLEPFPVFGDLQKDVIIYCRVDTANFEGNVYWALPNDQALGPNENRNTANFERHSFRGDDQGYFNLKIERVTPSDNGDYTCIYNGKTVPSGEMFTAEGRASLNVTDLTHDRPTSVACNSVTETVTLNESDPFPAYTCSANGGVPLAGGFGVKWYLQLRDNTLREIPADITVNSTLLRVTSQIRSSEINVTGEIDNSFLICTTGPLNSEDQPPTCFVPDLDVNANRIRVRHDPIVSFLPSSIEVGTFETHLVLVKCFADGNPSLYGPPELMFDDGINLDESTLITDNDTFIENRQFVSATISVTRSDVGRFINCTASNDLGTTTVSIEIKSLADFPVWLICVLIFVGGFLLFLVLLFIIICCCKCDLEHERKKRERHRRTVREAKGNGLHSDDELNDIDFRTYDSAPVMMMPESPSDNYQDSEDGSALVNDFKIEEPDEGQIIVPTSNNDYAYDNKYDERFDDDEDDDDDEDPPKREYLQVTIADDTDGEELQLEELSRDDSPSLNEL